MIKTLVYSTSSIINSGLLFLKCVLCSPFKSLPALLTEFLWDILLRFLSLKNLKHLVSNPDDLVKIVACCLHFFCILNTSVTLLEVSSMQVSMCRLKVIWCML